MNQKVEMIVPAGALVVGDWVFSDYKYEEVDMVIPRGNTMSVTAGKRELYFESAAQRVRVLRDADESDAGNRVYAANVQDPEARAAIAELKQEHDALRAEFSRHLETAAALSDVGQQELVADEEEESKTTGGTGKRGRRSSAKAD